MEEPNNSRRRFMQYLTFAGVGGQALLKTGNARAALFEAGESSGLADPWPAMTYRQLGRTGFNASRLIFGCGATLSSRRRDDLLHAAFDHGVNVFDVGYSAYYGDAEKNMASFVAEKRDDIFLISKALVPGDIKPDQNITTAQAAKAAKAWAGLLDGSLRELGTDHVDAYYLMGSNNVDIVTSDEIQRAFDVAKQAGKVSHFGISTHQNAANVLKAAAGTGWYSLAMIAITPGGWYDFIERDVLPDSPPMVDLQSHLQVAKDAGIGLIGMKAGRFLAGRKFLGWGNPDAFDKHYSDELMRSKLTPFQRSYAFVLAHGIDAVNADMQSMDHLKQNFIAAATTENYFNVA